MLCAVPVAISFDGCLGIGAVPPVAGFTQISCREPLRFILHPRARASVKMKTYLMQIQSGNVAVFRESY
jgi:hypothetical protein